MARGGYQDTYRAWIGCSDGEATEVTAGSRTESVPRRIRRYGGASGAVDGLDEPLQEGKTMNKPTEQQASPVFGLRYLEDREVEGLDVVGCLISNGGTATGCDDHDQIA